MSLCFQKLKRIFLLDLLEELLFHFKFLLKLFLGSALLWYIPGLFVIRLIWCGVGITLVNRFLLRCYDMMNDESDISSELYEFLDYLDKQMKLHSEYITEADEEQLERIAKLVEGVDCVTI